MKKHILSILISLSFFITFLTIGVPHQGAVMFGFFLCLVMGFQKSGTSKSTKEHLMVVGSLIIYLLTTILTKWLS